MVKDVGTTGEQARGETNEAKRGGCNVEMLDQGPHGHMSVDRTHG